MPRKLTKQELGLLSKVRQQYRDLYKVLCERKRPVVLKFTHPLRKGLCYAIQNLPDLGRTVLRHSVSADAVNWKVPKQYQTVNSVWLCTPFMFATTLEEQKALVEIRLQVLDWYLKYKVI